jgi:hypothetical protein
MKSKAKILSDPNPYPQGYSALKASESQSPEHHSLFIISNATSGEVCELRRHSAQSKEVQLQKLFLWYRLIRLEFYLTWTFMMRQLPHRAYPQEGQALTLYGIDG